MSLGLPWERPSLSSALRGKRQHKPWGTSWLTASSVPLIETLNTLRGVGLYFRTCCPPCMHTHTCTCTCTSANGFQVTFSDFLHAQQAEVVLLCPPTPFLKELILVNTLHQFIAVPLCPAVNVLIVDHTPTGLFNVFEFTALQSPGSGCSLLALLCPPTGGAPRR